MTRLKLGAGAAFGVSIVALTVCVSWYTLCWFGIGDYCMKYAQ